MVFVEMEGIADAGEGMRFRSEREDREVLILPFAMDGLVFFEFPVEG